MSLLSSLKGALIVSCQAGTNSPFRHTEIICAFARAAVMNGARALRLEGLDDVRAVRARETVPIIGLIKRRDREVFITPAVQDVHDLCDAGADIIAFDATLRSRESSVAELINAAHQHGRLAMADISTMEEALAALEAGADIVGTTLSGYTPYSPQLEGPDYELIRALVLHGVHPIAEGRVRTPDEARRALELGAHAVVVGSAITRPDVVTSWFAQAVQGLEPRE